MKKFICAGTVVKNPNTGEIGVVLTCNHETAIVMGTKTITTESRENLEVISYEEVE